MRPLAFLTALAASVIVSTLPVLATDMVLITPEEAKLPPAAEVSLAQRALTRGPGVSQIVPGPQEAAAAPLPLQIGFTTRNGVPIDPASVRLVYLKRPNIDLTARIKPFVTPEGVIVTRANVPSGVHMLRIDVKDARGRAGSAIIRLNAQ